MCEQHNFKTILTRVNSITIINNTTIINRLRSDLLDDLYDRVSKVRKLLSEFFSMDTKVTERKKPSSTQSQISLVTNISCWSEWGIRSSHRIDRVRVHLERRRWLDKALFLSFFLRLGVFVLLDFSTSWNPKHGAHSNAAIRDRTKQKTRWRFNLRLSRLWSRLFIRRAVRLLGYTL